MNSRNKVTKLKTNSCAMCGKEYEMYIRDMFGGIAGVRTKYCSYECSRKAKAEREKNYKRKKGVATDKPKKKRTITRGANNYFKIGPYEHDTCFGCPFLGWQCRQMTFPICRPHSPYNAHYKRVMRDAQDLFYWS